MLEVFLFPSSAWHSRHFHHSQSIPVFRPFRARCSRCYYQEVRNTSSLVSTKGLPEMNGLAATKRTSTDGAHATSASMGKPTVKSFAADSSSNGTSTTTYQHPELGERWKEIQGVNKWDKLLDPIDPLLRSELIRYGDFVQVTYDGYDNEEGTTFDGTCRFAKKRLLEKTHVLNSGYEVTDYIYAISGTGLRPWFLKLVTSWVKSRVKYGALSCLMWVKSWVNSDNAGQLGASEVRSKDEKRANWIGYVAVTTDPAEIKRLGRRDILVAWRGTIEVSEWLNNIQDKLVPLKFPRAVDPRRKGQTKGQDLKIEQGFLNLYTANDPNATYIPSQTSARKQVLDAVRRLVKTYGSEELSITVTGHSLGGALAVISGYDMAQSLLNQPGHLPDTIKNSKWSEFKPSSSDDPDRAKDLTHSEKVKTVPITVFTFGAPRVGNNEFRHRLDELRVQVLRVANKDDLVPFVPGVFVNEKTTWLKNLRLAKCVRSWWESLSWTYIHVGESITIDHKASPYLEQTGQTLFDRRKVHNLEACYLHVLTGYQGSDKPWVRVVPRDLALVNKDSTLLLGKHYPKEWWQHQNKGLLRIQINGTLVTFPRERVDYPEDFDIDYTTVEKECIIEAIPNADAALFADAIATVDAYYASAANQ